MGHIQATGTDAAGRKQYRYHDRWRERRDAEKFDSMVALRPTRCPKLRRRVGRDLTREGMPREQGARLRRPPARPRLLPGRLGGLRRGERHVRPGDDAQAPRDGRRRRDHVRLRGQGRQAARPGDRRPRAWRAGAARSSAAAAAARSCWRTSAAAAGWTSSPRTSTSTSRTPPAASSAPRTSAPGAGRCSPPWRSPSPAAPAASKTPASAPRRAPSRRSRATWATPRLSPAPPTSTRACSTASTAGSRSPACCRSWSRTRRPGPTCTARSRRRVLDLIAKDFDSDAVERTAELVKELEEVAA